VERLVKEGDAVQAVVLRQGDVQRTVQVRGGAVMASGGFNRHPQKRGEMLPGADVRWCPGAPGHTGSAQDLALAAGLLWHGWDEPCVLGRRCRHSPTRRWQHRRVSPLRDGHAASPAWSRVEPDVGERYCE
jgi:hypothetical protein